MWRHDCRGARVDLRPAGEGLGAGRDLSHGGSWRRDGLGVDWRGHGDGAERVGHRAGVVGDRRGWSVEVSIMKVERLGLGVAYKL